MSDFRKDILIAEAVFDISMVAANLIAEEKIDVGDSRELFQTIYELAVKAEEDGFEPDMYMDEIEIYATKGLMMKYKDFSEFFGRVWWDIEAEDFIDELHLYKEFLTEPSCRGITFEEHVTNCSVEHNGTLELVRR